MMKRVYFVRHGETLSNRKHLHQGPDSVLSEKGKEQARVVGELLKTKSIDTIFCSNYVRARETAEIIGDVLDLPHEINESFKEFVRPRNMQGTSHYSLSSLFYLIKLFVHRGHPRFDDGGAENMTTVKNRAYDVSRILREHKDAHNIVIISHSIFMNIFVEVMCKVEALTLWEFLRAIVHTGKTPNTTIFSLEFEENVPKDTCAWRFVEKIKPSQT